MRFLMFSIGSIAVSALVHVIYHQTAINQMNRVTYILDGLGVADIVDVIPRCINFIYASTFIPVFNMGVAFFFSVFIRKVECLADEQLTRALINGME